MLGNRIRLPHRPTEVKPFLRRQPLEESKELTSQMLNVQDKPTTGRRKHSPFAGEIDRLRTKMKEVHKYINGLTNSAGSLGGLLGSRVKEPPNGKFGSYSLEGVFQLRETNLLTQESCDYAGVKQRKMIEYDKGMNYRIEQFNTYRSALSSTTRTFASYRATVPKASSLTPSKHAHTQTNKKPETSVAVGNDQVKSTDNSVMGTSIVRSASLIKVLDLTVGNSFGERYRDILRLKEEYQKLNDAHSFQMEKNRKLKYDIVALQNYLALKEEQLLAAEEDRRIYMQYNDKISTDLKELMQACKELHEEVAREANSSERRHKDLEPYMRRIAQLYKELEASTKRVCVECQDRHNRTESSIEEAPQTNNSTTLLEIMDRVAESTVLQYRVAELDSLVIALREYMEFYKDKLNKLSTDNSSLRNSQSMSASRLLTAANQQQQQAIDEIILRHDEEVIRLRQELSSRGEYIYNLRNQLAATESKIKHYQDEIHILNLKKTAYKKSLINRLEMDRQGNYAEVQSLRKSLVLVEEKNRYLSSEIARKDQLIASRIISKQSDEPLN